MNNDSMEFVIYIIHYCANKLNLSPADIYKKLNESGCILSYLVPHYEVLHTQSCEYIMNDIQLYLKKRGFVL